MIVVDQNVCHGCGLCARVCHESCIDIEKGAPSPFAQINHTLCSTCTQCNAICPQQTLTWDRAPPVANDRRRLPSSEQLAELFKQRRTVRRFKAKEIGRALLEEITSFGICAPTNNYELRAIIVDDPAIMEAFDAMIMRYVSWMYDLFYRPRIIFELLKAFTPLVNSKSKVKMEIGLQNGRTFDTLPAALVFVVGDRRVLFSEASAQYALYNMILYAQTKGIGNRITAAGPMTLDKNKTARTCLKLQRREHILAMVELGYPSVRFRNKVEGKTISLQWNGIALSVNESNF